MPVNPPPEFEEDDTLWGGESSCHTGPGEPSSDCPTDNVSDLLESDARVSLSDLFSDVTDEGASECGDPAILSDLTESHVDCFDQRYNLRPRLAPRISSGWATNKWTNPFHTDRLDLKLVCKWSVGCAYFSKFP